MKVPSPPARSRQASPKASAVYGAEQAAALPDTSAPLTLPLPALPPRRPVILGLYLAEHGVAPLLAAMAPPAARGRRHHALDGCAAAADAALEEAGRCSVTFERFERPIWLPSGSSVSEKGLGQWNVKQDGPGAATSARPQILSELREPLVLADLQLNLPLMWYLDQRDYSAPQSLHAMALRDEGEAIAAVFSAARDPQLPREKRSALRDAINARCGPEQLTPLMVAAKWGRHAALGALLAPRHDGLNVQINARSVDLATALWFACDLGDTVGVAALLQASANPNLCRQGLDPGGGLAFDQTSPLLVALLHGHCNVVRQLLAQPGFRPDMHAYKKTLLKQYPAVHAVGQCDCRHLLFGPTVTGHAAAYKGLRRHL